MVADFTTHNVRLNDGTLTVSSDELSLERTPWFKSAERTLSLAFGGQLKGRKIVDLGCLEGGFAAEFARLGMDSLGIEARKCNYENCLVLKRGLNLPNLNFAHDTVWNLEKYGPFDAIFCCGLLYHLDEPRKFIQMMSRLCGKVLILHTHYATGEGPGLYNLSPITTHEGLPGSWFIDRPDGISHDQIEGFRTASYENAKSFWVKKEYILQELADNGFDTVYEQYDFLGPDIATGISSGYIKEHSRSMFVGIKAA